MQSTAWSRDLRVTADGTGVVSHVGTALLRMLADRSGLTSALSGALAMYYVTAMLRLFRRRGYVTRYS